MAKPYRMQRIGILNHVGEIWTPETFDNEAAAMAYIANYTRRWPSMDLSNHRPVPVRVTVTALKGRQQ